MTDRVLSDLEDTGERMMPQTASAANFWEHVYRYRWAARYASGQRVLDVACGEGYGTAALQRAGAASVIGVDISPRACEHASRTYGIEALCAPAHSIPIPDASIDLIVSFETIEHLPSPPGFVLECFRLLAPGGRFIVSTPNRPVYRETFSNPHHCSEMDQPEFIHLLRDRFRTVRVFGQHPMSTAWWSTDCLAAEEGPWLRVRGVRRLRRRLQRILCPHLGAELNGEAREAPVSAVAGRDSGWAFLVNPYAIRRAHVLSSRMPMYLVALAER